MGERERRGERRSYWL